MRTTEIVDALSSITARGAGTDAERRAALELQREISTAGGRTAELQTFWCRPSWAFAQSWHIALGIAGSLVAVSSPKVGSGLVLAAAVFVLLDAALGRSPGRRLTPERASQNVVSAAPPARHRPPAASPPPVRLILTANYDAGRAGLVDRDAFRTLSTRLRRAVADLTPGWTGWLVIALTWTLVATLLRVQGDKGTGVAVVQLVPTIGLVIALALLLEHATAQYTPGAGDNGSGAAAAIALAKSLDAAPPANVAVELVLTGAGDRQGLGLLHHLRAHRRQLDPTNVIVVGFGPCAHGEPRYLETDGHLIPLAFLKQLRRLAAGVAAEVPALQLAAAKLRTVSPALPARQRGLPAISLLALDPSGRVPHSHQSSDTADRVHHTEIEATVQAGLYLVDAIDGYLAELRPA